MKNRYIPFVIIISLSVDILIHFPELLSLFEKGSEDAVFHDLRVIDVLSEGIFTFLSLIFLFWINSAIFHFNSTTIKISRLKIVLSFILTWLLSSLLGKFFIYLYQVFDIPAIHATVHQYLHPLRDLVMTFMVSGSSYVFYLIRRQQEIMLENQQLKSENIRNQYEALKNQLNPHMLFNSLNTLLIVVGEDKEKAQKYIKQLSKVLRYTLRENDFQSVSLHDEMEFVDSYIFLLKIRFEENLSFDIKIDEQYNDYRLPPMAIQMLVENAVKHNIISKSNPLVIRIHTGDNCIVVSNPIQRKLTPNPGKGIGLANLAKRYMLLYKCEIEISESALFCVKLPLTKEIS